MTESREVCAGKIDVKEAAEAETVDTKPMGTVLTPSVVKQNEEVRTVGEIVDLTSDNIEVTEKCIEIDLYDDGNSSESAEPAKKRQKVDHKEESSEIVIDLSEEDTPKIVEQDERQNETSLLKDKTSLVIDLSEENPDIEASSSTSFSEMSVFSFGEVPKKLSGAWSCYENNENSNYLKGCKWAPDGTCLMTNSEDNVIRVFNLPDQLYREHGEEEVFAEMVPVLKMKEADTVYDYCWYPLMSSSNPDTACLAVTSKETPVHLYDAFSGELRCSYRAYDQMDEIIAAHSISFDPFGNKLFCGFNKMIRVFDVTRPGRECQMRPTFAKAGQRGIISCIAHSPSEHGLYAAGSYSRSIALYQDKNRGEMLCMFEGQQGGVTHIIFSPDGSKLYSGGRKDNEIICWDLRKPGHILFTMIRSVQTNQRMYFDVTSDSRFVVSGTHDGKVVVWDTQKAPVSHGAEMDPILEPILMYHAHQDTANGLSLHPTLPVLATTSGQRHYAGYLDDSESDEAMEDSETIENSLKLWWMYPNKT